MSPHRDVLTKLVLKHGWERGAELGVQKGILFEMLLERCPFLSLIGVDIFLDPHHLERCHGLAQTYAPRATVLHMTTAAASAVVGDGSLDFVFIDADHSREAVTDDITRWRSKVRLGGWLGGHDYNRKFPGVVQAVDAIFGKKTVIYPGSIWGVAC